MMYPKSTEILPGVRVSDDHFGRKSESDPVDMSHQTRALAQAKQAAAGTYLPELKKSERKPTKII